MMRYYILLNSPNFFSAVVDYWEELIEADLLRYRLPETKDPTMGDVEKMVNNETVKCFSIFDMEERRISGEFMLDHFQGLTAQVHFSIHPEYRGAEAIRMCRSAIQQFFSLKSPEGGPYRTALVGLTPESNRLAIRFLKKCGFFTKTSLTGAFLVQYKNKNGTVQSGILSEVIKE